MNAGAPSALPLTAPPDYFEDPSASARIATWFIGLVIVVLLVNAAMHVKYLIEVDPSDGSPEAIDVVMSHQVSQAKLRWWTLGALFLSGFAFLTWLSLVNKNAWILRGKLKFTPTSCVVWWLVPFANFWLPYQVVLEQWRASAPGADWRTTEVPAKFGTWWFCGFGASFIFVVARMGATERQSHVLLLLADVLLLSAAPIAIWMVERISKRQIELHAPLPPSVEGTESG